MYETGNSTSVVETTFQKAIWSPDDTSIATLDCYVLPNVGQACSSGLVRVWNAATGTEYFSIPGQDLEWNRTGERILVSDGSIITQWFTGIQDITRRVCQMMPRKLTEKEWQLYLGSSAYQDTCAAILKP